MIARLRERRIAVRARSTPPSAAPAEIDRLVADPRRACRLLGWRPATRLGAGLRQTICWMDTR
jgi:nucleoside-diphosphate-sugar epimerase